MPKTTCRKSNVNKKKWAGDKSLRMYVSLISAMVELRNIQHLPCRLHLIYYLIENFANCICDTMWHCTGKERVKLKCNCNRRRGWKVWSDKLRKETKSFLFWKSILKRRQTWTNHFWGGKDIIRKSCVGKDVLTID